MINYRIATPSDVETLCEFGIAEFTRTFGHLYSSNDLNEYLKASYTHDKYLFWIESQQYIVYIAYDNNDNILDNDHNKNVIAGYVLAGSCDLPFNIQVNHSNPGEIKRLYLDPSYFGKNISNVLLSKAIDFLRENDTSREIYLGVYSENFRALKFYIKNNFLQVDQYLFQVGNTFDKEYILKYNS